MRAQDVMVHGVIAVGPDMPVLAAAHSMVSNGISALLVMDISAKLVGIVSEGDLIRRVETDTERRRSWWKDVFISSDALAREFVKSHARRVVDVMTRQVITASPETPLREIADLMEQHAIKRVPIFENDKVIGIVSRANLVHALAGLARDAKPTSSSDQAIRDRIVAELAGQSWAPTSLINVIVRDGVVELWGSITDERERQAIIVAAENVPGVKAVEDHVEWSGLIQPHF